MKDALANIEYKFGASLKNEPYPDHIQGVEPLFRFEQRQAVKIYRTVYYWKIFSILQFKKNLLH
jgi:hypothetical protein